MTLTILHEVNNLLNELVNPSSIRAAQELPSFISAGPGTGRQINLSEPMNATIHRIATALLASDPKLKIAYTAAEWFDMVRTAFGPAIAPPSANGEYCLNPQNVLNNLQAALAIETSSQPSREFAFGCTLFEDTHTDRLTLGPVSFESRQSWLKRKLDEGRDHPNFDEAIRKEHLLKSVDDAPFICSVLVKNLGPNAAEVRAITAARLAITAIGLTWISPSSALQGANLFYDRKTFSRRVSWFGSNHRRSTRSQIVGRFNLPYMPPGHWNTTCKEYHQIFQSVSDLLHFVVDADTKASRSKLMSALTQAMAWFSHGCREGSAMVATTHYASCLDALSCGGRANGIIDLITARMGIKADAALLVDGTKMKSVVMQIYNEGRSRLLHGTSDRISHDWSEQKAIAEYLARHCLVTCLEWVAQNPTETDPKRMKI